MVEKKRPRPRRKQTYVHRMNAVHLTVYSPDGGTIPAEVRKQAEQAVTDVALQNGLLVGIATT